MKTTIEIKVRGYHVDHFNHVNNARYLEFLEEARWDYCEKNNLINEFHHRGMMHVTVSTTINYRKSAHVGQVLKIGTEVSGITGKRLVMGQNIYDLKTDILIADAMVTNVFLDVNTGKALPVNASVSRFWPDLSTVENREGLHK